MKRRLIASSILMMLGAYAHAADISPAASHEITLSGQIDGHVNDSLGRAIAAATVALQTAEGKTLASTQTDAQGHFVFSHLATGMYALVATKKDFQTGTDIVNLMSAASKDSTITLSSIKALEIDVVAKKLDRARNGIAVDTGSSNYHISSQDIAALPQGAATPVNQVLLQAPGVAQDSYGQLHIRGDHGNVQYRINDIIIPESISGFGQSLDTRFASSINLLTGALPAQYGYRTAGVVDIHTKSGAFEDGGRIGTTIGSNDTRELSGEVSGHKGDFSYYLNASSLSNNLGIENPTASRDAIHDATSQHKEFGYFSYLLSDSSRLSLILGNADSKFQIPNTAGLTQNYTYTGVPSYPSENLNENQHETTRYGILALQGTLGDAFDYQVAAFSRYSKVLFAPDVIGDLIYNGVASQVLRTSQAYGVQADGSYRINDQHTLRSGVFVSQEHLDNNNDVQAFTLDGGGNPTTTLTSFSDINSKVANLDGVYVQDEWKATDKLTVNYGVRFDQVDAYVTGSQLSPRLGAVYQIAPSTTLHAGYARYFTPPPNELISGQTIALSQGTTAAPPGTQNDAVQPESTDYYDIGLSHKVTPEFTIGVDSYYKHVTNLLDEGQFGAALLYTPFNYAEGKIYGAELTGNYHKDNFSAYFNIAHSVALGKNIVSAQYNFAADELAYIANNWVHLDHDQTITASVGSAYRWRGTKYSADAVYGSGLRSGFANTSSLPAYVQVNVAAARSFDTTVLGKIEGRVSVLNLFDSSYEIRDGSGIGVGAPQYGPRRAVLLSLDKFF
ncbi:TonB-dependent receptor [Sulfuriferula nivalis]|uniref:TonB-dependent receptor n=1 Tax=Sulfuriferula nivalis TaxID=2675298 RepID=A0A809SGA8_9PROT|nr:TonB-dependent receptor [Sulfuriferula nivalis]BBO99769.1 TonB-dependent receptor [Sulfuriferula nivalis]